VSVERGIPLFRRKERSMKRRVAIRLSWIAVIGLAGMVIAAGGRGFAQEPAAGQPAAKKSAKSSGRLPAYYAKVVGKEQREKILSIQADYAAKIESLRRQIDSLTKERDGKIAEVLTPDQRKQIDDLKAAAQASRKAKKPAKDKPADK
jgi:hypothetical protein